MAGLPLRRPQDLPRSWVKRVQGFATLLSALYRRYGSIAATRANSVGHVQRAHHPTDTRRPAATSDDFVAQEHRRTLVHEQPEAKPRSRALVGDDAHR